VKNNADKYVQDGVLFYKDKKWRINQELFDALSEDEQKEVKKRQKKYNKDGYYMDPDVASGAIVVDMETKTAKVDYDKVKAMKVDNAGVEELEERAANISEEGRTSD
jgi:predicted phosphoribosyltransferase